MSSGILVDTGPLVATANERDPYHAVCVAQAQQLRGPFFSCWPVITEAAYLLRDRPDRVQTLLARICREALHILLLQSDDMDGVAEILVAYADQKFDFADATLMHLAARESIESVFTMDHRHFSVYRTPSGRSLTIRPAAAT